MTKVKRQRVAPYTLIDNYLFDNLELAPNAKLTFMYLLRYTNSDGIAFPGLQLLSKQMCISKPTVVRMLKFWEWTGFLSIHRSKNKDGNNKVNVYSVNDMDLEEFLKDLAIKNALDKKDISFNAFFEYYIKNDNKDLIDFEELLNCFFKG